MAGLRKNSNTGILLGVCSGISEWSGIPVNYIRIGTVLGSIISFNIVGLAYLFLAGVLSDTAECNIIKKPFNIKNLTKPWWRKDFKNQ